MGPSAIREIITYGLVGLSALAVQDIFYLIVTSFIQSSPHLPLIAMLIGNLLGMAVSYIGHNRFTFKRERKCYKEFGKFIITSAIGLAFNLGSTYLLINELRLNHNFGLIPTLIAPLITYSISKFWVFT